MRLVTEVWLRAWAEQHPGAKEALLKWRDLVRVCGWKTMDDVVRSSAHRPSPVSDRRVVFNIRGNEYRLVAQIDFRRQIVYIAWFGTHAEYDLINPATVPTTSPRSIP